MDNPEILIISHLLRHIPAFQLFSVSKSDPLPAMTGA
jgi:hypothetical protein